MNTNSARIVRPPFEHICRSVEPEIKQSASHHPPTHKRAEAANPFVSKPAPGY